METNLVVEGFKFLVIGMGTVFLFLAFMIFMMGIMSNIVHKFFPEVQPKSVSSAQNTQDAQNNQKKIVAAITAAIKHHRES
ncbi:MAG: pyruvate carboxylase [Sulfurimonas sp. RIFOXYD12_FULL_33_39]|uniref:OadG family protein n=1 Tax=unclassified Sulfurimonas TaxID=2623549 RepID=UPI0008AC83A9|nr:MULTISPECIES: OadG family protein [unclassified Sulfurimonas]OHE06733.1 MAG: pyruvate carboxylase [Sulfurimonas sp. RIFCSPLOWO2_12_FULL_34_6]OHE09244.1 MAG: pyruvate carboxylase [Sulfurimonas sp. RIFOXYD12_FULL_33_39]OHE12973.1 MAG: pyruvate carboxylase [Sulfurimonas sp. RIFOXYD2_FULL_34_21]